MFGFGSLIGGFVDKKSEPTKEWGQGWDNDEEISLDEEDNLSPVESPAKAVKPVPDKSEKTNTFGMMSKIISVAGNLVSNESGQRKHDQQVMDLLVTENRQLRQLVTKQSAEIEDIKEQQETLRSLEEETQDENEVLKFKVKSLEAQIAMEKGCVPP